jgi:hypothetical protein
VFWLGSLCESWGTFDGLNSFGTYSICDFLQSLAKIKNKKRPLYLSGDIF